MKLAPIYQGVHPLDPRYRHIYAYCQKHGLPILIHMATTFSSGTPLEYARPAHMDQVAMDFPELRLVLAHLGHPWEGETIAVIRRNANVYADLSALYYRPWQFYNSMRLLVEYRAEHKVLFGSDFPFTTTADSLAGRAEPERGARQQRPAAGSRRRHRGHHPSRRAGAAGRSSGSPEEDPLHERLPRHACERLPDFGRKLGRNSTERVTRR